MAVKLIRTDASKDLSTDLETANVDTTGMNPVPNLPSWAARHLVQPVWTENHSDSETKFVCHWHTVDGRCAVMSKTELVARMVLRYAARV